VPDSWTTWEQILLAFTTLITGGLGAQEWRFRRHERRHDHLNGKVDKLAVKLPEAYRNKDDCREICGRFEKVASEIKGSLETMRQESREDLQAIFKRLDGKEDKH